MIDLGVVGSSLLAFLLYTAILTALNMAIHRRSPNSQVLHHSDRSSVYVSDDYQDALKQNGFICSMNRRGNCHDNAVVDRFFGTFKTEAAEVLEIFILLKNQ
jgi:transposase InsO family protein